MKHQTEHSVHEAADLLGMGTITLFRELRRFKIFSGCLPYRCYVEAGYFRIDARTRMAGYGAPISYPVALITEKGLGWLRGKLNEVAAPIRERNPQAADTRAARGGAGTSTR
jgi:hypothetical protein